MGKEKFKIVFEFIEKIYEVEVTEGEIGAGYVYSTMSAQYDEPLNNPVFKDIANNMSRDEVESLLIEKGLPFQCDGCEYHLLLSPDSRCLEIYDEDGSFVERSDFMIIK